MPAPASPQHDDAPLTHWRLTLRWPQRGIEAVLAVPISDKARKAGLEVWHGSVHVIREREQ